MLRNEKGFTLIEIIAVLVILGILAAVAIPKYLDVSAQARILAAQGAIAEVKGRLSSAQAKYMMTNNGNAPTSPTLYTMATNSLGYGTLANLVNVGPDFVVTVTTGTPIAINVVNVAGAAVNGAGGVQGTFAGAGD